MSRTVFTEPQCLYSTVKTIIPHVPYGLYRVLEPVRYKNMSTLPMGLTVFRVSQCVYSSAITVLPLWPTDCTDPQCLYSKANPLLSLWIVQTLQCPSACTVHLLL